MEAYEIHAVTHAEIHSMLKIAERSIRVAAEEMALAADEGRWADVSLHARRGTELVGEWHALACAMQVITGMDVLLDDKTTRGVTA